MEAVKGSYEKTRKAFGNMKDKVEMHPIIFITIQIIVGLVIAWIIYIISLMVLQADKLVIDNKFDVNKKQKTDIVAGYADASAIANNWFNASIDNLETYLPLRPSSNLKGGAQFTYQLWMYVGSPELCKNQVIFLRGDSTKYMYTVTDNLMKTSKQIFDRIAVCPMLAFGSNPMEFNVHFNTLHNVKETLSITRLKSDDNVLRHNLTSLFSQKWFMLTLVFEDNMPISDFENGLIVKAYVNDVLYQVGKYSTTLRQNTGNLYIFPDNNAVAGFRIADFAYYNYAVTDEEIRTRSQKGPTDKATSSIRSSFINNSMLSDLNRLEISNT